MFKTIKHYTLGAMIGSFITLVVLAWVFIPRTQYRFQTTNLSAQQALAQDQSETAASILPAGAPKTNKTALAQPAGK